MKPKWILLLVSLVGMIACAPPVPEPVPEPAKVNTDDCTELTTTTAVLHAHVDGDLSVYESIVFGMLISTNEEDVINHQAEVHFVHDILSGADLWVSLLDLVPGTTYYYCAWIMLNAEENQYGEVKSFTTPAYSYVAHAFSVSHTEQVYFSRGNLQYHPLNQQWRFAENQYDCVLGDNKNITQADYDGWLDLFGWGTGANPILCTNDNNDYADFVDWGVNVISNDSIQSWRTMSYDEWLFLSLHRPNADKLYCHAYVRGVEGLLLFPDDWDLTQYWDTDSSVGWFEMEQRGAVFLPLTKYRKGKKMFDDASIHYTWYWSSTNTSTSYRGAFYFNSKKVLLENRDAHHGYAVRLVRNAN